MIHSIIQIDLYHHFSDPTALHRGDQHDQFKVILRLQQNIYDAWDEDIQDSRCDYRDEYEDHVCGYPNSILRLLNSKTMCKLFPLEDDRMVLIDSIYELAVRDNFGW